jgi:hypothetical protein
MATWTFKNPSNGYTEEVNSTTAFLGALLLGPIYFALRGIWGVAIFLFILNALSFLIIQLFLIAIPLHIIMAMTATSMIKTKYLRMGWINEDLSQAAKNSDDLGNLPLMTAIAAVITAIVYITHR